VTSAVHDSYRVPSRSRLLRSEFVLLNVMVIELEVTVRCEADGLSPQCTVSSLTQYHLLSRPTVAVDTASPMLKL
jgi:hypothetical protein